MFDFGFSELIVIGIVMLVVVGPERLPKVARTVGHVLGRIQRYVADVKSDIQREMQLDELKKLQEQVKQQAQELDSSVRGGIATAQAELGRTENEIRALVPGHADGAAPSSAAAPATELPAAPDPQLELGLDAGDSRAAADKAKP